MVGSVHKLLATNSVHRNIIIHLTYTNVQESAVQLCTVYVINTACLGFMVNNHLSSRVEPEDKGGYCKP